MEQEHGAPESDDRGQADKAAPSADAAGVALPPPVSVPEVTSDAKPPADSLSSTVAKWLIPSVTALFVVVGYMVQAARQALLGVEFGGSDSTRYIGGAADFFGALPTVVADSVMQLSTGAGVPLADHGAELVIGTGLVVVALLLQRSVRKQRPWPLVAVAPAALMLLIACKFVVFDAPLGQIENMILGSGQVERHTVGPETFGRSLTERLNLLMHGKGFDASIAARATDLWEDMVCSRIGAEAIKLKPEFKRSERCNRDHALNRSMITGEFVAQLWAGLLIAVLAIALLRSNSALRIGLGILALAYLLTVPYAYGKLMKSTYFDYGAVRLAETLAGGSPQSEPMYALILSRSAVGTDLLVVQRGPCANGRDRYAAIKLSSLSASQVLSVEEIYREDVITWATLNEKACPAICVAGQPGCSRK